MAPQLARDLAAAGPLGSPDVFLPARKVWERYGVTSMTLYRWLASPDMAFPAPVYLGRFRYWKLSDVLVWEASRPRAGSRTADQAAEVA